ncbi:MAG TPA: hypothetical protein PLF13_02360 [candidate division Zixibacteria bacterium]|nr:hypothetical protein [candidate division Zixibacteria bacterium]
MLKKIQMLPLGGLIVSALLVAGCLIVSGTFVIVKDFDMTAEAGFYFYQVDLTTEPDWDDHKDDIDFIDAVGVEFTIVSTETSDVAFSVYVDDYSGAGANPTSILPTADVIIDSLTVSPGTTRITYGESLTFLRNIPRLKSLVRSGKFDYYAGSTGNDGETFVITEGKVVVTLSASGS